VDPLRRGPLLATLALTLCVLAPAEPAAAAEPVRVVDPTAIRCAELLRLGDAERTRVALWLDGLLKGARWGPTDRRGDTAVGRSLSGVLEACAAAPERTLVEVWSQRYPGGPGDVHPLVLTCREWAALSPGLRAQVVAWNEGFAKARAPSGAPGFAVPVARDLAPLASACRRTPERVLAEALSEGAGSPR